MPKERTFEVLSEFEGDGGKLELVCEHCGTEAVVPTKGFAKIEAVRGMGYVWDPAIPLPDDFLPEMIKCRNCHYEFRR